MFLEGIWLNYHDILLFSFMYLEKYADYKMG